MSATRIRFAERQVLLWILGGFMLAFALAFLVVALRQRVERADMVKRPTVYWLPANRNSPQQLYAEMMDPSLMSLPNPRGYSRNLWQRGAPAKHQALAPVVELAYLAPSPPQEVPTLLPQPVLADAVRWTVGKPPTAPATPEELTGPETTTAATQSVFRVEGELASRLVVRHPELPRIAAPSALRPTNLRIGVSIDGIVRYVVLQRSSGNEQADAQALALARDVRFEPQNRAEAARISWGVMRFLWAASLPPLPVAAN